MWERLLPSPEKGFLFYFALGLIPVTAQDNSQLNTWELLLVMLGVGYGAGDEH